MNASNALKLCSARTTFVRKQDSYNNVITVDSFRIIVLIPYLFDL